jgi:hypothetical protein
MDVLHMNRQKSGYVPIVIPQQHLTTITSLLRVNPLQLPITYLGLPLTYRNLTNALFQPLLTALERRLQGQAGSNILMAGRTVFLNCILNALLIYYMQAFWLSQATIDRIITLTRKYLWRGGDTFSGGHCLVNWGTISLSKKDGGLGVIDLRSVQDLSDTHRDSLPYFLQDLQSLLPLFHMCTTT